MARWKGAKGRWGDGERRRDEARGQQKRPERGNKRRHRQAVSSQDKYPRWLTGQPRVEVSVEKRGVVCALAARPREREGVNRHERGGCCRSRERAFNGEGTEKEGREEEVTKTEFGERRDGKEVGVRPFRYRAKGGRERLYTRGRTGPRPHGKVSRDWRRLEWRSGRTGRKSGWGLRPCSWGSVREEGRGGGGGCQSPCLVERCK